MVSNEVELHAIQILVKFFTPKTRDRASFSTCVQFLSLEDSVCDS